MRGAERSTHLFRGTERRLNIAMFGAAAAIGVAGTLISRAVSRRRAQQYASRELERAVAPDGVFMGAESITLDASTGRAALLLHGFNDTPQSLVHMGRALHARGWMVRIPLLPQHGRGAQAFLKGGHGDEWIACAREEWAGLRTRSRTTLILGQSMGGALSVILAAEAPPSALVLLAPYLSMTKGARILAPIWPVWQLFVPQLRSNPDRALRDPAARAKALGGTRFSPRLVAELLGVVRAARRVLDLITCPTLVIHARADYRIPSASAQEAYERIGAKDKTLIWSTRGGHVVAADEGKDDAVNNINRWLDARFVLDAPAVGNTFDAMRNR